MDQSERKVSLILKYFSKFSITKATDEMVDFIWNGFEYRLFPDRNQERGSPKL